MTAQTEFTRTDTGARLPRWLTLVLFSVATLVAIGALWALAPSAVTDCGPGYPVYDDIQIVPGPQPCGTDATGPALTTAGILITLLAAVFVVAFTVVRRRGMVMLILGGSMLLVLIIGLLATVVTANTAPPVIYY